jgi:hypothetical protein
MTTALKIQGAFIPRRVFTHPGPIGEESSLRAEWVRLLRCSGHWLSDFGNARLWLAAAVSASNSCPLPAVVPGEPKLCAHGFDASMIAGLVNRSMATIAAERSGPAARRSMLSRLSFSAARWHGTIGTIEV